MAINTGVNVSKLVGYAVLAPPTGVDVSKLNAYAVLGPVDGLRVSKVNLYAVLAGTNVTPPSWPSFAFVSGIVGVAYSQDWDLAPAASPTTYSVVSGALPTGLLLTNVGNDVGRISGIPLVDGTFSFTLRATNFVGTKDKAFSITILPVSAVGGGGGSYTFLA